MRRACPGAVRKCTLPLPDSADWPGSDRPADTRGHPLVSGYEDHVARTVVKVPFEQIHFDPNDHFAFEVVARDGSVLSIPLHRVREVHRNGELIWHRRP